MPGTLTIIVCRSSNEPLSPGSRPGYQCTVCRARIQVSPTGRKQLETHPDAKLMCNPCGFDYARAAEALGKLETKLNPNVVDQLPRLNTPAARWLRDFLSKQP